MSTIILIISTAEGHERAIWHRMQPAPCRERHILCNLRAVRSRPSLVDKSNWSSSPGQID